MQHRAFYYFPETDEEVLPEANLRLEAPELFRLFQRLGESDEDFLGMIDEREATLQVIYQPEHKRYWFEIPDPERGGSYGGRFTAEEAARLFENLPEFFDWERVLPGLQFQSW
ncbi:MAG: hypothetical protein NXI24_15025 [bacterium]|nr:hypothetical protein [bacterium]